MFNKLIDSVSANPRILLLIDGIGALMSAFLYGIVLANLVSIIGMPKRVLYLLCVLACLYAIFSFSSYFRNVENWAIYLKIIASANLFHCGLTLGLMFYYHYELTALGLVYFIVEIIVVTSLAVYELNTAKSK